MITITKIFEFEASHHLPYHEGACHNLHGHSYKLEVTVGGERKADTEDPECGMIMDFSNLKDIVGKRIIRKVDHSNLNDHWHNPTAEIMVQDFANIIKSNLPHTVRLVSCKLWETSKSYAEYRP